MDIIPSHTGLYKYTVPTALIAGDPVWKCALNITDNVDKYFSEEIDRRH